MNQTVFNYPDKEISLKVLDLIFIGKTEEAYDILSGFYHVPKLGVKYDNELFTQDMKRQESSSSDLDFLAYYKTDPYYVNFKNNRWKNTPHTVLHEFYHHLEHLFELRGERFGNNQVADSWAEWFVRSIDTIGEPLYDMIGIDIFIVSLMEVIAFLKAVKNGDNLNRIRGLKKHKRRITSKEVFYSRTEKKYHLTPVGEKLLEYGIMGLNNWIEWQKNEVKLYYLKKEVSK